MIYKAHNYQRHAEEHVMQYPEAGLFLDMGLGKTAVTLTAINRLLFEELEVSRVLVIAPLKVAEHTWTAEGNKWDHLRHLKISVATGTERQRIEALRVKADIYTINRENVPWLVSFYASAWPFDMTVIDELSSFKNPKAVRFKALRTVRPLIKRMLGLTGTPAPNGLLDLWSQLYLLDQGERLGKTLTGYRDKYFSPDKRNGHVIFEYNLRSESDQKIMNSISDICISMKAKDYLELPKRIDRINLVQLPPAIKAKYEAFERDLILTMDDVEEISAVNAAALTNKLLQFANGAVYDDTKAWHEVHTEKLQALEEDIEAANGQPVMVFYSYRHDVERIMKHLKAYKPVLLTDVKQIDKWNRGEIPLLLAHPASAGHGLNMQDGGHLMIWYGLQWGLELYEQGRARLDRQGQTKPVINTRMITAGTMDEDVLAALDRKATLQDSVMEAVKARIKKYKAVA